MAHPVKNPPAMQRHRRHGFDLWDHGISWEDPMEAEMATHSSILAWKTSRSQRVGHNRLAEGTHAQQPRHVLQEAGSGNPIENVLNLPPKRIFRLQFFMH